MAIQVRRGKENELDTSKAVPGEWLVSTDTRYVRMCFAPGIVLRMATYEAFEADMEKIEEILKECQTIEEAVKEIYEEFKQVQVDIEIAQESADTATQKAVEAAQSANSAFEDSKAAEEAKKIAIEMAEDAEENAEKTLQYSLNAKESENTAKENADISTEKAEQAVINANLSEQNKNDAELYATEAESYARGGTGSRLGEDVDNAKYYYEQAKHISQGGNGLIPLGTIAFENLPTDDILANAMYNINNDFTSDDRFVDGGGILYGKGSNIFYTVDGKWDVLAASDVKGVKGANENTYRQGLVNITADNIGLGNVNNTSDADKPISDATQAALGEVNERIDESVLDLQAQIDATNSNLSSVQSALGTVKFYSEVENVTFTDGIATVVKDLTGKGSALRCAVVCGMGTDNQFTCSVTNAKIDTARIKIACTNTNLQNARSVSILWIMI